jgi:hypothetical protein
VHDVVIGVAQPEGGFVAHAWLDFESDGPAVEQYAEIYRLPGRSA